MYRGVRTLAALGYNARASSRCWSATVVLTSALTCTGWRWSGPGEVRPRLIGAAGRRSCAMQQLPSDVNAAEPLWRHCEELGL